MYRYILQLYFHSLQGVFNYYLRYNKNCLNGEVQEWFNWLAWKACVRVKLDQGFESLPLRHKITEIFCTKSQF